MFSLLLALFCQPAPHLPEDDPEARFPRPFLVYVDDSPRSKLLVAELTRDWTSPAANVRLSQATLEYLCGLNDRRVTVMARSRIILKASAPPTMRHLSEYPCFTYGEYGKVERFDQRMFCESGFCLFSMETMIHNADVDVPAWQRACERARDTAEMNDRSSILSWLRDSLVNEYNDLWASDDSEDSATAIPIHQSCDRLRERFADYDGCPGFIPAVMPPCPLWRFPFEK